MAASEIEICNSALIKIGQNRITGFTDDSKAARICAEQYAKCRDELLMSHPWNFAMARVELAALTTTPVQVDDTYTYQFQLPSDCLRVWKTSLPGVDDPWSVEGGILLAEVNTIKIQYIRRVTEPGLFSAQFAEVLAWRIAWDISYAITQKLTLTEMMMNGYQKMLSQARTYDSQEGSIQQVEASEWFDSRY